MFVYSSKSNLPSLQIMRRESITALELRTRLLVSNFREGTIYVGLHFLLKNFTTRASLWGPLKNTPHRKGEGVHEKSDTGRSECSEKSGAIHCKFSYAHFIFNSISFFNSWDSDNITVKRYKNTNEVFFLCVWYSYITRSNTLNFNILPTWFFNTCVSICKSEYTNTLKL